MPRRPSIKAMSENLLDAKNVQTNFGTEKTKATKASSFTTMMLEDFIYLNMKR